MNVWLIDRAYYQDINAVCTAAHNLIDILAEEHKNENRLMHYIVNICTSSSHVNVDFCDSDAATSTDNGTQNVTYIHKLFYDYNIYQHRNNRIYDMNNMCFNDVYIGTIHSFKDITGDKDSMHDTVSSPRSYTPVAQSSV